MEVMRMNLGSGWVTLAPIPGTTRIRVCADHASLKWRGQLEMEEGQFQAMLDARNGAAAFDERDEFEVLYRTRQHIAKRVPGTSVHNDVHAHWFIELLDLETKQRFVFTSAEWNALFTLYAVNVARAAIYKIAEGQEPVVLPPSP